MNKGERSSQFKDQQDSVDEFFKAMLGDDAVEIEEWMNRTLLFSCMYCTKRWNVDPRLGSTFWSLPSDCNWNVSKIGKKVAEHRIMVKNCFNSKFISLLIIQFFYRQVNQLERNEATSLTQVQTRMKKNMSAYFVRRQKKRFL